jgi:predicted ATP-dependent endonuclease of OLD family
MEALRYFLLQKEFSMTDFTITGWRAIDEIGRKWENDLEEGAAIEWDAPSPFLDVWLAVNEGEVHYVQKILPTLDWQGGELGVRLRLEPNNIDNLRRRYLDARDVAKNVLKPSMPPDESLEQTNQAVVKEEVERIPEPPKITLWPETLTDFLQRRLRDFVIQAYILDPDKRLPPQDGIAQPQILPPLSEPLEGDPFKGLMRIDEISAQRGFGENKGLGNVEGESSSPSAGGRRLSDQLRSYYEKHLDPYENPDPADLEAISAFEAAQKAFNVRLEHSFSSALKELQDLGYPGFTDPRLNIATRFRPTDSLRHESAVQYVVPAASAEGEESKLLLPEGSNGLGFQNLISIIFRLMSFRDAWLQVGKAAKRRDSSLELLPPLHLVLIEEPEAHLHAQVQQVFVHRAYDVLRNHEYLRDNAMLTTQLVISTHSSHIAHESDFRDLRYFRRLPASQVGEIPTSCVINLANVFGHENETHRFVTRYLKVTHCDLFFADGAILVEGPAERILVPHFVRENEEYRVLNESYLTWLEIGGSHAHRLRSLIETLGIVTLIITDIDAKDAQSKATRPCRGQALTSRNATLRNWVPGCSDLDELLAKSAEDKVVRSGGMNSFTVRVAYQSPVTINYNGKEEEALANTFEDALVFQNLEVFRDMENLGLVATFKKAIEESDSVQALGEKLFTALKFGTKAELALDLLEHKDPCKIKVPQYIDEGLHWLAGEIGHRQKDVTVAVLVSAGVAK